VGAEVSEVAPRNIAASAHRPPEERNVQLPEVSGVSKRSDRQLMRRIEWPLTMQANGFAIGGPLPGSIALEVEWRAQADMRTRLQESGQHRGRHEFDREARDGTSISHEAFCFFSVFLVPRPQLLVP
jgi:hypothetical protein